MNKKRKLESDEGLPIVVSSSVTVKQEDIETDNEEDNTSFRPMSVQSCAIKEETVYDCDTDAEDEQTEKKPIIAKKKDHELLLISVALPPKKANGRYYDWQSPQGQAYIQNAVRVWDEHAKYKEYLYQFAERMKIPTSTLQLYCCANKSERLIAGAPRKNNIGLEVGKIKEVALELYRSSPNKLVKRAVAMKALQTKFGKQISEGQSSSQWSKVVKPRIEELMRQAKDK